MDTDYNSFLIERFAEDIEAHFETSFGHLGDSYRGFLNWASRMALERIRNSDMLYHDVDHT